MGPRTYELYGSYLSPFSVKARLLCEHAGLAIRRVPEEAGALRSARVQLRRLALTTGLFEPTHPDPGPLGELPLVPFLFGPDGESYWDSTAIGHWLDSRADLLPAPARLLPEDPSARFCCNLIDEATDEIGLYLLHHHRWVTSGATTKAIGHLTWEYASLLSKPIAYAAANAFATRQVARLPYLFSVAPRGFALAGVPRWRQPPSRDGFPPTHALLDELFDEWLDALEHVLSTRPFLFGHRLCLADASVFGMLSSQVALDPAVEAVIRRKAPHVRAFVERLAGPERGSDPDAPLSVDARVEPLLELVNRTFVPLMQANERAYVSARRSGQRLFNEAAFDRGEALFEGEMLGHPYRTVVKTFQVKTWRALRTERAALGHAESWLAAPSL